MNDRARFDVLVCSRPCGYVIEAAPGVRDASEGAKMHNHLVRERPLGHAEMTRMETIMLAAGWSTALVAVFIRLIGIG
jgi:hypothetical protein